MPDGTTFGGGITLASLAADTRWVAWQVQGRGKQGKPTKVPYAPGGALAKADDPRTWGSRADAETRVALLPQPFGIGGVGLELGDHGGHAVAGVDLDTCRAETGDLAPWALEVLSRLQTYAETSPSGTGVKAFFRYDPADAPAIRAAMGTETGRKWCRAGGDHPPGLELYVSGRFFAVTDDRLPDAPPGLRLMPLEDVLWLIREAGPALAVSGPGKARTGTRERGETRRRGGASGDRSRSARAFKIAADVKRAGGDFPAFLSALEGDPDAAGWKADKGEADGGRELRRTWERAGEAADDDILLTEHGVALAFAKRHAGALRYSEEAGSWFVWSGTHWRRDRTRLAFHYARSIIADANAAEEIGIQAITGRASYAGGVERFARADPGLAITLDEMDRDPFLLATPGGTVDLRVGIMRLARPGDLITRVTAVAPSRATPPDRWLTFLDETTGRDDALIGFLQRWCGYCLTGDTREHALLFGYGPGGNGKSVLLNTVAHIMGDYATTAAMDTFTASHGDKHSTDLAMLRGARLVTASETEEGRAWAESRIKAMTGGDPITARFMRQDNFTYVPQFKLTIVGNHKPILRSVDDAVRRRFNIVPFLRKPAKPDKDLEAKLREEAPAILAWMIEGCLRWQAEGLNPPPSVRDATAEYFEAQDHFGRWLVECCEKGATWSTRPGQLLASFTAWCEANGEDAPDNRRLRGMLEKEPGVRYAKNDGTQWVRGLRLYTSDELRKHAAEAAAAEKQGQGGQGGGGSNP